ncbi:MAG: hypothetical protein AAGA89_12310 [Pseudomonadota bacterium]
MLGKTLLLYSGLALLPFSASAQNGGEEHQIEEFLSPPSLSIGRAFQNSLLLGCIAQLSGTVEIPAGDERAANDIGLSWGAPTSLDRTEYIPLAIGIAGGATFFEQPVDDAIMVVAVGDSICRIGFYDKPTEDFNTEVTAILTAETTRWISESGTDDTEKYRWKIPPSINYSLTVIPQQRDDRLTLAVQITQE